MITAFQPTVFQNNAFQVSFSMDAFQKCAFQYQGFQTSPCPDNNSARSGHMRLFFYNLQEEALKKDEQVQGKETPQGKGESKAGTKSVAVESAKPKQRKPARNPVEVIVEDSPPVRLKPMYHRPEVEPLPDISLWLNVVSMEFRAMLLSSEPVRIAMLQREAANEAMLLQDEEEEEILLLLAA